MSLDQTNIYPIIDLHEWSYKGKVVQKQTRIPFL